MHGAPLPSCRERPEPIQGTGLSAATWEKVANPSDFGSHSGLSRRQAGARDLQNVARYIFVHSRFGNSRGRVITTRLDRRGAERTEDEFRAFVVGTGSSLGKELAGMG